MNAVNTAYGADNVLERVPSCSTWPPAWLSQRSESVPLVTETAATAIPAPAEIPVENPQPVNTELFADWVERVEGDCVTLTHPDYVHLPEAYWRMPGDVPAAEPIAHKRPHRAAQDATKPPSSTVDPSAGPMRQGGV